MAVGCSENPPLGLGLRSQFETWSVHGMSILSRGQFSSTGFEGERERETSGGFMRRSVVISRQFDAHLHPIKCYKRRNSTARNTLVNNRKEHLRSPKVICPISNL